MVVTLVTTAAGDARATQHKHRQTVAPTTRDTDTSTTAAIPSKGASDKASVEKTLPDKIPPEQLVPDPKAKDDEVLPPPFHLPTASRQRMRECGLKWQSMKTSGKVGEEIWRDFATGCLAAANSAFDKHSER